jgi:Domain of unknown function (DUF4382)
MGLTSARKIRTIFRICWNRRFRVALLFVVGLAGCDTCFAFTSNPPTGVVGIMTNEPRHACTLRKVTSAVRLRLGAEPACSSCPGSGQIQHIFLGIRGIELNPNVAAGDDSPEWQEILPEDSSAKPLQIDLMQGTADHGVPIPLGETAQFPAGIYRRLRLRLAPNQPAGQDRLPEKNMCGSGRFNCIVMADGSIHPLLLNDDSPELRITSDKMEGASLFFPPDTRSDLIIEWKLVWELSSSADTGVRLLPTLAGTAKVSRFNLEESGTPEDEIVTEFRSR